MVGRSRRDVPRIRCAGKLSQRFRMIKNVRANKPASPSASLMRCRVRHRAGARRRSALEVRPGRSGLFHRRPGGVQRIVLGPGSGLLEHPGTAARLLRLAVAYPVIKAARHRRLFRIGWNQPCSDVSGGTVKMSGAAACRPTGGMEESLAEPGQRWVRR